MPRHVYVKITGKVHGVNFRHSAKRKAEEFGIAGYVENKSDGSIFIEAEGHREELARFLEWCKRGPSGANVEDVDVSEGSERGYHSFKIKD